MIRYIITYLTLILSCERLLGGESLTQRYFRYASMTARASNFLISQREAQLKAVQMRPKMDAGKPFFEPLNDQSVYQYAIPDDTAAELENIDSTLDHGASVHELTNENLDGNNGLASKNSTDHVTHKPHLRQRLDTTACSAVSAALFDAESFSVLPHKANGVTTETTPSNSPSQIAIGSRRIAIANRVTSQDTRAVTTYRAALSSLIKTDHHYISGRLSPATPRTSLLCKTSQQPHAI